jgi:hypothetical protein
MANTLPTPTEGLVYSNPTTGKRMKFSDGCWKPIDYLPLDGSDSMQDTLWTPDQLINSNTLTADSAVEDDGGDDNNTDIDWNGWNYVYGPDNDIITWFSVAYGNGKYVAVGASSYYFNSTMHSEDGINWTTVAAPASGTTWTEVIYVDGKFWAVGYGTSIRVMYSEDLGESWIAVENPGVTDQRWWNSVTYGNGKFVAVARVGNGSDVNVDTPRIMYSENGTEWTMTTSTRDTNDWQSVTYGVAASDGVGRFVAVARRPPYDNATRGIEKIAYSEDGINWTAVSSPDDNREWLSVTYGDGRFVAVGGEWDNYNVYWARKIMYSDDGINWTSVSISGDSRAHSLTYGSTGYFVATGEAASGEDLRYSKDGVNWTKAMHSHSPSANYHGIVHGGGRFVAVGGSASKSIMYLDAPDPASTGQQDLYFNGDPVVTDTGMTRSLATLLSTQSTKLGRTKYYQDSAPPSGVSYELADGPLWYQPTSNNLHFYNDSDQTWVQL